MDIITSTQREVSIRLLVEGTELEGQLQVPAGAGGLVVFAHGSGSSRLSPRNRRVAESLGRAGLATLLFDLLTPREEEAERYTRHLRFNIPFIARRLVKATLWVAERPESRRLAIGYFGASTGAAAALAAAAELPDIVKAVVSRGGRPDLAGAALQQVKAPSLYIVGSRDSEVIELNRWAMARMQAQSKLVVVPGAGHLFEEPGALEEVAALAADWFRRHLVGED